MFFTGTSGMERMIPGGSYLGDHTWGSYLGIIPGASDMK